MKEKTNLIMDISGRRKFLKQMSTGAAGLAFVSLFQPDEATSKIVTPKDSRVYFVTGTDHREAAYQALKPLEKEIENAIQGKQVIIKPNVGLTGKDKWVNITDVNQIRGILDFLKPIYDKKVTIGEGAAEQKSVFVGYENFNYLPLSREYNVKFIDMNDQSTTRKWIPDGYGHPQPIHIIDYYLDPDVYMISACRLKPSGGVIVTLSLKNVVMGSPLNRYKQKKAANRNDKPRMHAPTPKIPGNNHRALSYNIFRVATMGVQPDLAVLDGVVGVEGDGPWFGTPVEHGVALASTDWLAADRLGAELMGVGYNDLKYLIWCSEAGMGQYDLSKIKVIGPDYTKHIMKYKMNKNFEHQRAWIYEDTELKKTEK